VVDRIALETKSSDNTLEHTFVGVEEGAEVKNKQKFVGCLFQFFVFSVEANYLLSVGAKNYYD
jgi:hypothetical protein